MGCSLSIFDAKGTPQFSQDFSTRDGAIEFLEVAVDPLIAKGAKYIVVDDETAGIEQTYRAKTVADCISAKVDWANAMHRCLYVRPYQ